MTAFTVPLQIDQGSTFTKLRRWRVGDPRANVDLTGCTAEMHIRASIDAATKLLTLTTENGGITLGGTAGTILITITAAQTEGASWRSGVYDLRIVFADGVTKRRLMTGDVTLVPGVTRG